MPTTETGLYYLTPEQVQEMNVVAFSGRKNSGKSTLGKYVIQEFGFSPEAMARHLKAEAVAFQGLPIEEVWGSHKSPPVREWMEQRGHGARVDIAMDIWLRVTECNLYFAFESGVRNVVLTDIRYPNEVAWVQQALGGAVYRLVGRGDTTSTAAGEVALDGYNDFRAVLDNSPGREKDVLAELRGHLAVDFGLIRR